jgi:hypothetical protein
MLRLIKIEWQKIWLHRSSKILLLAYFLILSSMALIASIEFTIGKTPIRIADQGIFNFPYIWHFNTYIASWLKIFLAIVIVSMISNEYTYGTLKQNLIDGFSKKEFLASKILMVLIFSLVSVLFVFVMTMVLGYRFSSYTATSIVFTDISFLAAYGLKLMGFFMFCLFLGIWIKRSAFALGFLFVWFVVESIIYGLSYKFVNPDFAYHLKKFFPLESFSNLIKEPFTRLDFIKAIESTIAGEEVTRAHGVSIEGMLISLAWVVIFVLISYRILLKRDL